MPFFIATLASLLIAFPGNAAGLPCERYFNETQLPSGRADFKMFLRQIGKGKYSSRPAPLPKSIYAFSEGEWRELATRALGNVENGINGAFLAVDPDGNKISIMKNARSKQEFGGGTYGIAWDIERGGTAKREVFSYELDRLLDFGLVPPTAFAKDDQGRVLSMQKFMDGYLHSAKVSGEKVSRLDHQKKILFDIIIGTIDRHIGNFLIHPEEGKLALIDNGASMLKTKTTPHADVPNEWLTHGNKFALGAVEESLRRKILSQSFEEIDALMTRFEFPASSRKLARERFAALQAGLRENHSIEQLVKNGMVRDAGWGRIALRELILIPGTAAAVAGFAGYKILIEPADP